MSASESEGDATSSTDSEIIAQLKINLKPVPREVNRCKL
jgi:hypothetical protein